MIQAKSSLIKAVSLAIGEQDSWTALPTWAKFFIELGWGLGEINGLGDRMIVGVSVPSRAYAAAFAALGTVLSRAAIPVTANTADEHFGHFAELPPGTPVTLIEGNRKLKGLLTGCKELYGEPKVGVQVENKAGGSLTHWLPAKQAHRISARPDGEAKLPKKKTRHRIVSRDAFLKHLLAGESPWQFASASRLDCVLLGSITVLRQEIRETVFGLPAGRQIEAGTLNDVLCSATIKNTV